MTLKLPKLKKALNLKCYSTQARFRRSIVTADLPLTQSKFFHLKTSHSFHLVDPSPWPLVSAFGAFALTTGTVLYLHKYKGGFSLVQLGVLIIIYVMCTWWRDVIREALFEESHNKRVQRGLRLGVILFIVSEVMFFFSFFWAYFYFSSTPNFSPLSSWPPRSIKLPEPFGMALLNTCLLLTSGASITWAHHATLLGSKRHTIVSLSYTIFFAVLFMKIQLYEYKMSTFSINSGIYGSCFYMLTGFHGFHVFVGTVALLVSLVRCSQNHLTLTQHIGLESAIWYWHFVDVVWILVFVAIYWWGSR